jgi:hypothetical protein
MQSLLDSATESLTDDDPARVRVLTLLRRADARAAPYVSSWPGAHGRPATLDDYWATWHVDGERALLVQLAPRQRDDTDVDVYLVCADASVRRLRPRGCLRFRRRTSETKSNFPTVVLDGTLAVRATQQRLVFAARSCLWTSRCYHGAVDSNVQRALHARAFIEHVFERDRILEIDRASSPLDLVYVPLQSPTQLASVAATTRPRALDGVCVSGIDYWLGSALHVVGADPRAHFAPFS